MNTRPPIESSDMPVALSVAFNDDCSHFSVGLDAGFAVFNSATCESRSGRDFHGGIGLVQMLGRTNMHAIVGGGRQPKFPQNKAMIWNDSKGKIALEITTMTAVRGVQLSKERVVVVLQNSVRVYGVVKPPNLLASYETADNVLGLCSMSEKTMAFPGRTTGQIQLVDIPTGNVSIIPAHSSALRAIAISRDGELLATASEAGTLIRVFALSNGAKVAELRRGIDAATIYSLAFNPDGTMLACTSDKATLHIFDVSHPNRQARAPPSPNNAHSGGSTGNLGSASSSSNNDNGDGTGKWGFLGKIPLMPRVFSDVYSFASTPFEVGDEPSVGGLPASENVALGTSRPIKGIIGWIGSDSLLVVGAGKDARWEKFTIREGQDGRRICARDGWKRYLTKVN